MLNQFMGRSLLRIGISVISVATLSVGLAIVGGASAGAASKPPVHIEMITTLHSSAITTYPQAVAALKAATDYVNSTGGIKGAKLEESDCDDQFEATIAQSCTTAAVNSPDVAIVGATETFPGVYTALQNAGLVITATTGLTPFELQNPDSFPITSGANGWFFGAGALAVKLGAKKVSIVECNDAQTCGSTATEVEAALKIAGDSTPAHTVTTQLGQAVTASEVQQVISQDPQAVVFAEPGPYPQEAMTLLKQQGYTGKIINDIGSFGPENIPQVGDAVADGTYASATLIPPTDTSVPAIKTYDTWMKKVGAPTSYLDELSLLEWTGVLTFATIARRLPRVTRASVLKAYKTLSDPVNIGTGPAYAVVGHPSPLPCPAAGCASDPGAAPQLHVTGVYYDEVKNGKYVPLSLKISDPFVPAS